MSTPNPDDPAINAYLDYLRVTRRLAELTLTAYRRDLALLHEPARMRDCAIETLSDVDLRRAAGQLHARGLSARSLARLISAWRGFYDWLAHQGRIVTNPAHAVRAPRVTRPLPKALSVDATVQLVSQSSGVGPLALRDRAMAELFYSCGLRLAELVGLDVQYSEQGRYRSRGWVDWQGGEVTVTGKGDKRRAVPIGAPALQALQAWLQVRSAMVRQDAHPLFLSERGQRIAARTVQDRLKTHARRLGTAANVHPHVLRHSFASHLLQSSGDLRAVQELLGHANISATQVYTRLDFQHLAKAYDAAHPRARKKGSSAP